MSRTLTLSGNSSILTSNYFPPIDLNGEYICALADFQTYNSIPNIDEDNNNFYIGNKNIKIPIGSYEIEDIEEFIKKTMEIPSTNKKMLQIRANNNTLKCEIYSEQQIDFEKSNSISKLLGFSQRKLEPNIWHSSDLPVDINKINIVRIECNIIHGTYINDQEAHILHEFSIGVGPGYKIIEVPQNLIYLPVAVKRISYISIRLLDQNGNLINFRGETVTIRLHLKQQE